MGVAGEAMSGIGALGSALGGKGSAGGQPFQSAGGVTPQQADTAAYTYGQNLVKDATEFQGEGQGGGTSMSTMATNAATGSRMQEALDLGQMSDVGQAAQYNAYRNAQAFAGQNIGALSSLGGLAAKALGGSGNTGGAAAAGTGLSDSSFSGLTDQSITGQ